MRWTRHWEAQGKGKPKVVKTDNGGEFVGKDYTSFCAAEGIDARTGAPYTPQSQAVVERANGTVKKLLKKVLYAPKNYL